MTYHPDPIDTSSIEPSDDLRQLLERLARNVHEQWAQKRIAEGWTWGPHRDDHARTHPDVVPYDELAESEKDLDRQTAGETVKALLALGYRIEAPTAARDRAEVPSAGAALGAQTAQAPATDLEASDLPALLSLWRGHDPSTWSASAAPFRLLAGGLRAAGEPLLAYDVIHEGLDQWPEDLRLRQLLGLVLADSGAPERANAELTQLVSEGHDDEETLGMLARTQKDLWARACDADEQARYLRLAQEAYQSAYRRTGGYWTGINAARLAALRGSAAATPLAIEVHEQCLADLARVERDGGDRYWAGDARRSQPRDGPLGRR